jgi:hypothetical protein
LRQIGKVGNDNLIELYRLMAEVGGEVIDDVLVTLTLVELPAALQLPFSVVAGLQSRRDQPSNRGREHKTHDYNNRDPR